MKAANGGLRVTQQKLRDTSSNRIVQAILTERLKEIETVIGGWRMSQRDLPWMSQIEASVQLIAEAFEFELKRLLRGDDGTSEWTDIVRHVRILTYRTLDQFLALQPDLKGHGYYFHPSRPGEQLHKLLTDAAYQFGISLRQLERVYPPCIQVLAEVDRDAL